MNKLLLLLAAALMFVVTPLQALITTDAGVGVSTLGVQLGFGNRISDDYAARLQLNGFKTNFDFKESGVDYKGDLTLLSAGAMFDWHPMGNDFRLTLGTFYNGNKMTADAQAVDGSIRLMIPTIMFRILAALK